MDGGNPDEVVEFDVSDLSKEKRTQIHNAVKRKFGKNVIASTCSKEDKKFIQFRKFTKGGKRELNARNGYEIISK